VISGFCREAVENCPLLGCYVDGSGKSLPTFRDNLSVPCSGFENPKNPEDGTESCPETSAKYNHYSLRNNPEERSSQRDVQLKILQLVSMSGKASGFRQNISI
jgi:hypothetical protein